MKQTKFHLCLLLGLCSLGFFSACSDDVSTNDGDIDKLAKKDSVFGKDTGNFTAAEWYAGGELGTTQKMSYSASTPVVDATPGMFESFQKGEDFFEHAYNISENPRRGLGPAWVRSSCIHCHPGYGHGKRQESYNANTYGNGYLLVIYNPTTNAYISEVTGMPQTKAMTPFKAPIDESQITIRWRDLQRDDNLQEMPSGIPFTFADGETFSLIYPDVYIPQSAFNTDPKPSNYEVRLESTIGVYGTGLLDAIDANDMKEQYQKEAQFATLNPAMWDTTANDWASTAWYTLADGQKQIKKFTYAMTRASLQDGPGANAIWNITNVTRSDRHYFYSTAAWAKAMSNDNDVISYIKQNGSSPSSILYPYYADGTNEGISSRVNELLSLTKAADSTKFKQYFVDGAPYNGLEEMSDKDYYDFMVWHRGLAVPAARNLDDATVQRGKELFYEIGCTSCHRPSWTTGEDNYWVDNSIKAYAKANSLDANNILPKYPHQTIWPYTDLVQHRLFMKNDIRTGWCRTTPLWGRGLSAMLTGADDRLHDTRARSVLEAIMWHGYSAESDAFETTKKFYNLPKTDRDAIIKFIESI